MYQASITKGLKYDYTIASSSYSFEKIGILPINMGGGCDDLSIIHKTIYAIELADGYHK
jgi:hypothetical protein